MISVNHYVGERNSANDEILIPLIVPYCIISLLYLKNLSKTGFQQVFSRPNVSQPKYIAT